MTQGQASVPQIGDRLAERYELLEILEEGNLGRLFLARDPHLERTVAVKVFDFVSRKSFDSDGFLHEAQRLAQLQHPCLIPIFDFGRSGNVGYFVQPLPRGQTLAHWLQRGGLGRSELLWIAARLAEVLAYLGDTQLMHRDLSTETVRVARSAGDLRVWLHDFCLESILEVRLATSDDWPTACRATEFQSRRRLDGRSDLFALGALVIEAWTGNNPWQETEDPQVVVGSQAISSPKAGSPATSSSTTTEGPFELHSELQLPAGWAGDEQLERLIAACLDPDPDLRPKPRAVEKALDACRRQWGDNSSAAGDLVPGTSSATFARDAWHPSTPSNGAAETIVAGTARPDLTRPDPAQPDLARPDQAPSDVSQNRRRDFRAQQVGGRTPAEPLVGRQHELGELLERLYRAESGQSQWVLLSGETGMGKSRLMQELDVLASRRGVRVLTGHCSPSDESFPLDGFCSLLQHYFRSEAQTYGDAEDGNSGPTFDDLAVDLLTLFPALEGIAVLRRAAIAEVQPRATVNLADDDATRTFELMARTLARLAASRPLLILMEGLHRSVVSAQALEFVHHRLASTPLMVVSSYRASALDKSHGLASVLTDVVRDDRTLRLDLGPLEAADHAKLAARCAGVPQLPAVLAARLYEATDGNPLFTLELVRGLASGEQRFGLDGGAHSGSLEIHLSHFPETITQVVTTRLEHLDGEPATLLSLASVLGHRFTVDDLLTLALSLGSAEEQIDRLLEQGLLQEVPGGGEDLLQFSSGVVRDVLYQRLPRRRRRILHRRYAELLEERHQRRLERIYPQLVHHFSAADAGLQTVTYALMLARQLDDVAGSAEVVRATRAALDFIDDESLDLEALDQGEVEGELRQHLAAALRRRGSTVRSLDEAERGVAAYERAGEQKAAARLAHFAAETAWRGRRLAACEMWVRRGCRIAEAAGETVLLRELLIRRAMIANLRGEHLLANQSLEAAEALVDRQTSEDTEDGGNLVTVLPHPLTSFDPADFGIVENLEVLANVFECLVTSDADGQWLPGLAESWQAEDDGRSFVFHIRRGVVFSDGHPLDAEAVKQSLERSALLSRRRPPPALMAIEGWSTFDNGASRFLEGVHVEAPFQLRIRLQQPLPIFPVMLSELRVSVARLSENELLGTGPFVVQERSSQGIRLERNARFWQRPAALRSVEFRTHYDAAGIAAAWTQGRLDMVRDLAPQDLETLQQQAKRRGRWVEAPRSNVYYLAFNASRSPLADPLVRQAMCRAVGVEDLVWRTLGRLARPATNWLPPGVLGHDPETRASRASPSEAEALLQQSGVQRPLHLRAMIHPLWLDRYAALTQALIDVWSSLGIEVSLLKASLDEPYWRYEHVEAIDLLFDRWLPDYEDPDNFSYGLFDSRQGLLRNYVADDWGDAVLDRARQEASPTARRALYLQWQGELRRRASALPMFHDIDYRLASLRLDHVALDNRAPYVNFARLSKAKGGPRGRSDVNESGKSWRQQSLRIPLAQDFIAPDPLLAHQGDVGEVAPNLFETLTRVGPGARVIPWLAQAITPEDGARRFRVSLRPGVRFHDGRSLTAQCVKASWQRLLRCGGDPFSWRPLRGLRGAMAWRAGEAEDLEGCEVLSELELLLHLEHPSPSLPSLLTCPSAAIAVSADGSTEWSCGSADGWIGTGPFRRLGHGASNRLELEASPYYWRHGLPRADRLVFEFGIDETQQLEGFQLGRYDLISQVTEDGSEALRQVEAAKVIHRQVPSFSTLFMIFNCRRGPFADVQRRIALTQALLPHLWHQGPGPGAVQGRLEGIGPAARGLIPPGLLGALDEGSPPQTNPSAGLLQGLELRLALHPFLRRRYGSFWRRLEATFERLQVRLDIVECRAADLLAVDAEQRVDLALTRWVALYPDTDAMMTVLTVLAERFFDAPDLLDCIEQGSTSTEPQARRALYQDVERRLAEDVLVLPLFHEQVQRFAQPDISGLDLRFSWPEVAYEALHRS